MYHFLGFDSGESGVLITGLSGKPKKRRLDPSRNVITFSSGSLSPDPEGRVPEGAYSSPSDFGVFG